MIVKIFIPIIIAFAFLIGFAADVFSLRSSIIRTICNYEEAKFILSEQRMCQEKGNEFYLKDKAQAGDYVMCNPEFVFDIERKGCFYYSCYKDTSDGTNVKKEWIKNVYTEQLVATYEPSSSHVIPSLGYISWEGISHIPDSSILTGTLLPVSSGFWSTSSISLEPLPTSSLAYLESIPSLGTTSTWELVPSTNLFPGLISKEDSAKTNFDKIKQEIFGQ